MLAFLGLGPMELIILGGAILGVAVVLIMRILNSKK
jgi:hypothetical protein